MEVWFYIGTTAERPTYATKGQKEFVPALLPSASGELLPSLTKTYHGSRLYRTSQVDRTSIPALGRREGDALYAPNYAWRSANQE